MGPTVTPLPAARMGENVIQSLRGKIHRVPRKHKWRVNTEDKGIVPPAPVLEEEEEDEGEGFAYNLLPGDPNWTPMNSNLHMQGIKVVVHNPVPETAKKANSHDTTLLPGPDQAEQTKGDQEAKGGNDPEDGDGAEEEERGRKESEAILALREDIYGVQ